MRKFLPFVLCSLAALSYSQLGAAGEADPGEKPNAAARSDTTAVPADSTNATRGAQAGERHNGDLRLGQPKREESAISGSSRNNSKAMEKDDSTSAAPSSSATPGSTPNGTRY